MKVNYADALATLAGNQLKDLVNARANDIQEALDNAEDSKMSIGFTSKLTLTNGRLYATTSMRWSAVTKDETEGSVEVDDPQAPRLPGFQPVAEVRQAVAEALTKPSAPVESPVAPAKPKSKKSGKK